jgi:male germ cell-associated kinase
LIFLLQYAIKRLKENFSGDFAGVCRRLGREVQLMIEIHRENPFLLSLHELHRDENLSVFFVMDYMPDGTLCDYIRNAFDKDEPIPVSSIRRILSQVTRGIACLHAKGFLHRDLKPENLLMEGTTVKVADFSLSRQGPKPQDEMTVYVSTRWYRAPEIVLASPQYSFPVDIFALGCITAELFKFYPLFPSDSDADHLKRILELLDPLETWPEGVALAEKNHQVWNVAGTNGSSSVQDRLQETLPNAPPSGISLLTSMLKVNPNLRSTCHDILNHSFLSDLTSTSSFSDQDDTRMQHLHGDVASDSFQCATDHLSPTPKIQSYGPEFQFSTNPVYHTESVSASFSPKMNSNLGTENVSPTSVAADFWQTPKSGPEVRLSTTTQFYQRSVAPNSDIALNHQQSFLKSKPFSYSPAALFNI